MQTHSILDGSILLRFKVSVKTAARRSSGTQSLNPPFLACSHRIHHECGPPPSKRID